MPTDELSKEALRARRRRPRDGRRRTSRRDVDVILNEEHELIMVGEKSVDDGIADMESRVKQDVLD